MSFHQAHEGDMRRLRSIVLRSSLAGALLFCLSLLMPAPAVADCVCTDGTDYNGNLVSAECGEVVCGSDYLLYECNIQGWRGIPGSSCPPVIEPPPPPSDCQCVDGFWDDGEVIPSWKTFCGLEVCGRDGQYYQCHESGWLPMGRYQEGYIEDLNGPVGACPQASSCWCDGGAFYGGIAIDPADTYCGMTVCGADNQAYECTATGWSARGLSPCASAGDLDQDGIEDWLENLLIRRFAPEVRLHPSDTNRPSSVPWFLSRVELRYEHAGLCNDHSVLGVGGVNVQTLISQEHFTNSAYIYEPCQHSSNVEHSGSYPAESDFYLDIPSDADAVRSGSPAADWTCYAHVKSLGSPSSGYELQFWFFYPNNGHIPFYGCAPNECPEAFGHEGDWEHVSFQVDATGQTMTQAYLSAHEGGSSPAPSELLYNAEHRPVIYSAIDSHASYSTTGEHFPFIGNRDYTADGGPIWDCKNLTVNVGEVDHPLNGSEWLLYSGHWGQTGFSHSYGNGPKGPAFKSSW